MVKQKESEKRDKYLDLARKLKKTIELSALGSHQKIGTGTGRLGNTRTSGDHPNYSIVEIDQNTKKYPRDLRRLAVSVENHQLTLV